MTAARRAVAHRTAPPRSLNLRQLLLGASRRVHAEIVAGLNQRGYEDLRPVHTTLLTNLDLRGESVTSVANKAGMTKQAMGRIAGELRELGYLRAESEPADARAYSLKLTASGQRLMEVSFSVMEELEGSYRETIGVRAYERLKGSLLLLAGDDS